MDGWNRTHELLSLSFSLSLSLSLSPRSQTRCKGCTITAASSTVLAAAASFFDHRETQNAKWGLGRDREGGGGPGRRQRTERREAAGRTDNNTCMNDYCGRWRRCCHCHAMHLSIG